MQIVCTFKDFDEIEAFARRILENKAPLTAKELNESAKKTEAIINAAEAKEEAEKKAKAAGFDHVYLLTERGFVPTEI